MIATIAPLLEHDTAGDTIRGWRWTRNTTEQVAEPRKRLKIDMSPNTTERLWKDTGYSLWVNHKKVEPANKNPPPPEVRVWQFEHVNHMRENLACRGNPILSGDAKKKQQVGNIKSPGTS